MKISNSIRSLFVFAMYLAATTNSRAQLVNCNVFLQGNYVEVGININGAFGSSVNAPAGYHPRGAANPSMENTCTATCSTGPMSLGFVADPAKDGWTVGSPNYIGDYFLPGDPQEGWSVEVNGVQGNGWNHLGTCGSTDLFSGGATGGNVSYSGTGTTRSGTWEGSFAGLSITQVTTLDTSKVFFTCYVTLKNTTATAMPGVYYMRTLDPDNDQALPSGSFSTNNTITYQLPNALNATLVSATGTVYTSAYLGLGTLDCRAKCFILTTPLEPAVNCDALYAGSPTAIYSGALPNADVGIGIVFNLGAIAAGDSVKLAFAYILSTADLTAALNSTSSGWTTTIDTTSRASNDTSQVCKNTMDTVSITNPGTYTWSWLSITGEPLSTTTGPTTSVTVGSTNVTLWAIGTGVCVTPDTVVVNLKAVGPGAITASNSGPVCSGSILDLFAAGASGGTYSWTGPLTFTSTMQNPVIPGVTLGASGTYTAIVTLDGCSDTAATTALVTTGLSAIVGATNLCEGTSTPFSDSTGGGTWASSNTAVASVGVTSGLVTAGTTAGTATITYSAGGSCMTTTVVTVSAVTPISGTATLCTGSIDTLHGGGTCSPGAWVSTNTTVATVGSTGVVYGVSAGTSAIEFFIGTTLSSTLVVTVNAAPAAITPPGTVTVCAGATTSLGETVGGGTWSSSNTSVATVNSSGQVTGVSAGTANITYGSATCYVIKAVTVTGPAAISPHSPSTCIGSTITLTDATSGGSWISGNTAVATVAGGTVGGVTAGTATISYIAGGCIVTDTVTVTTGAGTISPAGSVTVCAYGSTTLTDGTPGGVWSSGSTGVATVNSSGTVYGVAAGTAVITYSVGSCLATKPVTVTAGPSPLSPTSAAICASTTATFTDLVSGGVWGSSNTLVATVVSGTVTGLSAGTATISYSIGSCLAVATVTVSSGPAAITPATAVTVCVGSTTSLGETAGGGVWASGNTGVATVSTSGVVTGVTVGAVTISYTIGSCSATKTVTVVSGPGPISPSPVTVCMGTPTTVTDGTGGGVWSSGNPFVATVSSGGSVVGVATGTTSVSYSLGACIVTAPVTVVNPPGAITATGPTTFCSGATTSLTDGTAGGSWSSSTTTVATVASTGTVYGIASGTTTITYSVGACYVTIALTVSPGPAPISLPSFSICTGNTLTLTDAAIGGVWSSTNTLVATVSSGGTVTGAGAGTAIISYTIGSCAATSVASVNLSASAGTITGPSSECIGSSAIILTDLTPGGAWTSGSTGVASVSSSGVVTGISAGTATISYSVTTSCGTAVATHMVTINASASAGTITGSSTVCAGTYTTLTDGAAGGVWSASNTTASISAGGLLTGIAPGTDTIRYTVTLSCGTASTSKVITVGPFLTAGFISGPTSVCQGAHIGLTDLATGGVWSSYNNGIATVNSSGQVTGVSAGIDTIYYSVTSTCGSAHASYPVTVNSSTVSAGTISGPAAVCIGTPITLTDGTTGGTWSITNTHASITSGGVVNGISAGTDTVKYTVTGACGTGVATQVVTVSTMPTGGAISGPASVCAGSTISLTESVGGGVWSASNTNASVGPTGMVTGVTAGTDVISYIIANACGTANATKTVTVNPSGSAGAITGPDTVCIGSTITLTGAVPGGVWSAGNTNASVGSSSGLVTGISSGSTPITYTITTTCGTATSIRTVYITSLPSTGVISGISIVCLGSGITLTESVPGGTWSASNAHASVVGPGIIDGVSLGVDTIYYSVSVGCVASASKIVSVDPVPSVDPITGPTMHCIGSLITLTDATPGGVWISNNPSVASVALSVGASMGVSLGVATISYTVTNIYGCPTTVTIPDTVASGPAIPPIGGSTAICFGAVTTLTDGMAGGTWSSSNTVVASIDPASGLLTGESAGVATITYTVAGACGAAYVTRAETVSALPALSAITGNPNQCIGTSTALADPTAGGVWSSSNTAIATVNAATGEVTGVATGTDTIYYSLTSAAGCSSQVSVIDNVYPMPAIAPITGTASECIGAAAMLFDATAGGTWSSSNTAIATVSASGIVTGITGGIVTISYNVTAGCTGAAVVSDTVHTPPVAAPITGATVICEGSATTLSNAIPLGVWASGNTAVATINASTGSVTGLTPGTTKIYYTVTNGCGTGVTDSVLLTILTAPPIAAITAAYTTLCAGSTVHLSDAFGGGVWSSAETAIATVGSTTGMVTGAAPGVATIRYTIGGVGGCSSEATINITVSGTTPSATLLPSGTATLCRGRWIDMHVVTSGTGLTYQWEQNGILIPGATDSSYTTSTTSIFAVIVSNGVCNIVLTDTVVIMSPPNPVIAYTPPDILYTSSFVTYQWFLNWVPIPGATTNLIHEVGNGEYHVVVTDMNGCTDTSGQYSVVVVNGVKMVTDPADIKIYPNPASTMLHVDAPVTVNVSIISIDGKTLIEQADAKDLDIHSLANGMYLIQVYDENKILLRTAKFAKLE